MPTLTTPHSWLATFVAVLALTGTPLPSLADGAPSAAGVAAAGWKQFSVEAHGADDPAINLALSYPTRSPARHVAMGPFSVDAAINAPSDDHLLGLIVLSHGAGGTELGHGAIAQALARHGYLVAALRHPGDNWQDSSLLGTSQYFYARPRQVSRVISALLADPQWGPRIATDACGPRIGALGHSAGGYTVIALVGGEPAVSRIVTHCGADAAADPIFAAWGAHRARR